MMKLSKNEFIKQLNESYKKIDHLSDRRLDYKYLEYNLFNILMKYVHKYDFTILGMPTNLQISLWSDKDIYDINKTTHVTLNAELFRLYESGYFCEEDFINYVNDTIIIYKSKQLGIKELVYAIRKLRLENI